MKLFLFALLFCVHAANAKFKINYISSAKSDPIISAVDVPYFKYATKTSVVTKNHKVVQNIASDVPDVFYDSSSQETNGASLIGIVEAKEEGINSKAIESNSAKNTENKERVFVSNGSATLNSTLTSWVGTDVDVVFKDIDWAKNIVLKTKHEFKKDLYSSIAQLLAKLNSNKQMKEKGIILTFSLNDTKLEIRRV